MAMPPRFFPPNAPRQQQTSPNICVGYPVPPPPNSHSPYPLSHSTPPSANYAYPQQQQQQHMCPPTLQNYGGPSQLNPPPPSSHPKTLPPGPGPPLSANYGYPQKESPQQQQHPPSMYPPRVGTMQNCDSNSIAIGCPVMGFPLQPQQQNALSFLHQQQPPSPFHHAPPYPLSLPQHSAPPSANYGYPQQQQQHICSPTMQNCGRPSQLTPPPRSSHSATLPPARGPPLSAKGFSQQQFPQQQPPPEKVHSAQQQPLVRQIGGPVAQVSSDTNVFSNTQMLAIKSRESISGKLVEEHRVTERSKKSRPTKEVAVRAMRLHSKESQEEIKQWREERKQNYPTTANIRRKAEELKARKARGELVDEDAKKRHQRIREVLSRQVELGLPVAEIPHHYISDGSNASQRENKNKRKHNNGNSHSLNARSHNSDTCGIGMLGYTNIERVSEGAKQESDSNVRNGYLDDANCDAKKGICHFFRRGFCKRGSKCEFLHEKKRRKRHDTSKNVSSETLASKRVPRLLAKLLESDIHREKSHLLQSFRFMVNNHFFLEYPSKPLNFFEWIESDSGSGDTDAADDQALLGISRLEGAKEVMANDDKSRTVQIVTKAESYDMGQKNCEDIDRRDSPDVWKVLQQRLLEDAGGMAVLSNRSYGCSSAM